MRKVISLLLCALQMLMLAACAKKTVKDTAPENSGKQNVEMITVPYKSTFYPLSGNFSAVDLARAGNRLLVLGGSANGECLKLCEYSEGSDGYTISDGAELALTGVSGTVRYISADSSGSFYALSEETDSSGKYNYKIVQIDEDGNTVGMTTAQSTFDEQLRSINVTASGKIVLCSRTSVYISDRDSGDFTVIPVEGNGILSASMCGERVIISVFTGSPENSPYYAVDAEHGEIQRMDLTNPYEFGSSEFIELYTGSLAPCSGLDGEYIINTGAAFIECDFDNDSIRKIYEADIFSQSGSRFGSACRLNDDSFAVIINGELTIIGTKEIPYTEKKIIKTAVVGMNAAAAVNEVNASGTEYEYSVETYDAENIDVFLTELISGKGFDLVLFNDKVNTSSDYFDDLYPYIDESPNIAREDFLPNLLECTGTNGQLHQLWDKVCVTTLAARESDVSNYSNFTVETYNMIVARSDKLQAVFDTYMSREELLSWVSEVGISSFVDYESRRCSFDDPAFAELLSWSRSMGEQLAEGKAGLHYGADEVLLFPYEISQPRYFDSIRDYIGGELCFVGFPDGKKGLNYYTCPYSSGLTMAIPKNSQNKEGAWAFIENRLSFENQKTLSSDEGIPVIYKALQFIIENSSNSSDGEKLYRLLENTSYAKNYSDNALKEIILTASNAYLAGDKSLDDTVSDIQSRASIYLAEQG